MTHYTITYLEHHGPEPNKPELEVEKITNPSRLEFDALYSGVGEDYLWDDLHADGGEAMESYLASRVRYLYRLSHRGDVAGFYVLSARAHGEVDLDYFGLLPSAIGQGLGGQLLEHAIAEAFSHHGAKKLYVHTCTLDHPRALPLYVAKGFVPVSTETLPLTE